MAFLLNCFSASGAFERLQSRDTLAKQHVHPVHPYNRENATRAAGFTAACGDLLRAAGFTAAHIVFSVHAARI